MSKTSLVTLIIPAMNEENRLAKPLVEYLEYLNTIYPNNFEIIVVINGTTDKTEQVVINLQEKYLQLKYLVYPEKIGKGGAIKQGYKHAFSSLIAFADADGSTKPETLGNIIQTLEKEPKLDAVIGSRKVKGSIVSNRVKFREVFSWGFHLGVNLGFNLGIKDTQCGAKVVRKSMVEKILPVLTISNMAFDVNLLVAIKKNGGKILEIPVEWVDDFESSIKKPWKTAYIMALSVFRLWIIYSPFKTIIYPVFDPFISFYWNKFIEPERELQPKD